MGDLTTPAALARERLLLQIAEFELQIARGHRRLLEIAQKDRPDVRQRAERVEGELAALAGEMPDGEWERAKVAERKAELLVQLRAQTVRLLELDVEAERIAVSMDAARQEIARLQQALSTLSHAGGT